MLQSLALGGASHNCLIPVAYLLKKVIKEERTSWNNITPAIDQDCWTGSVAEKSKMY